MKIAQIARKWTVSMAILLLTLAGCSTLNVREPLGGPTDNSLIPTKYQVNVGAFRVSSNVPMDEDDPAIVALAELEARVGRVIGVSVSKESPPIDVYILDSEQTFTTFLMFHHPELPSRRAFFLAVGEQAEVYTARGHYLEEDLRHEATHALLHRSIGRVPLWLDEGLAEYFETEPQSLPVEAIDRFKRLATSYQRGWRPDLKRIEELHSVAGMTPTDYREAWAWAVLLLHSPKRATLVEHLERLRIEGDAAPRLSEALRDSLPQLHRQFLAQVSPAVSPGSPSLTRLQSPSPGKVSHSPSPIRQIVVPGDQRRMKPVPVEVEPMPRGPISRLREGIGNIIDRFTP